MMDLFQVGDGQISSTASQPHHCNCPLNQLVKITIYLSQRPAMSVETMVRITKIATTCNNTLIRINKYPYDCLACIMHMS